MDKIFMWVFMVTAVICLLFGVVDWIAYGYEEAELHFMKSMLAYLFAADCHRDLVANNA